LQQVDHPLLGGAFALADGAHNDSLSYLSLAF
jgi:hypothetical protein